MLPEKQIISSRRSKLFRQLTAPGKDRTHNKGPAPASRYPGNGNGAVARSFAALEPAGGRSQPHAKEEESCAMISRKLWRKLEMVRPAVADHDLVPMFMTYCCTGQQLIAYNDRIGISTPLQSKFKKACVPAAVLMDMLKMSRSPTVESLVANGETALLKLGNTGVTLPYVPAKRTETHGLPQRLEGCRHLKSSFSFFRCQRRHRTTLSRALPESSSVPSSFVCVRPVSMRSFPTISE